MAAPRSMCVLLGSGGLARIGTRKSCVSHQQRMLSCLVKQRILLNNTRLIRSVYFPQKGLHSVSGVRLSSVSIHKAQCLLQRLWYSTADQKTGTTGLADEVLKAKLGSFGDQKEEKPPDEQPAGEQKSDSKKKDGRWTGKNAWKLGLVFLTLAGGLNVVLLITTWGAPVVGKDGSLIADEFSEFPVWKAYPKRAAKEFNFFKQMIRDPSSEKLLPDALKEPYYQPPYTLVLEMTGVLVHPDWTLSTGWRFKKRPGIDYFLTQVGHPTFEVVIYTAEQGFTAFPIIDGLDPKGYIMYRLFRDATRYTNSHHVKDLSCLNRDLSKVIIVDCNPNSVQLQPRNSIVLPKWLGNDDDRKLLDLAQFLRMIAFSGVEDVRSVLDHYNQYDDPLETFKERQQQLQVEQEKAALVAAEKKEQKSLAGGITSGLFGRRR